MSSSIWQGLWAVRHALPKPPGAITWDHAGGALDFIRTAIMRLQHSTRTHVSRTARIRGRRRTEAEHPRRPDITH
jgi:hypothetical protein